MTADICKLYARHLAVKPITFKLVHETPAVLVTLLMLLDLRIYESEEICENTCANVLQVIKLIARIDGGYEMICNSLDDIDFSRTIEFLNIILTGYEHESFIQTALDCISTLLARTVDTKNTSRFNEKLDSIEIRDYLVNDNVHGSGETDFQKRSGSEALMKRLIQLFDMVCAKDKPKNGVILVSKLKNSLYNAMHALLKSTNGARTMAESKDLLPSIMDRLDTINSSIGMSSNDFIRKFGDKKVRFRSGKVH